MTNPARTNKHTRLGLALACLTLPVVITSCGKKEDQAADSSAFTPAPVTPPPAPRLRPADLGLASKVQFPAELMPENEDEARGVASLANAIASGDADNLAGMLDRADAAVLSELRESGDWERSTAATTAVRVVSLQSTGSSVRVGLAIEDPAGAYLLGWEGTQSRGSWTFRALPVVSPPASKASDLDGVALAEMDVPAVGPVIEDAPPPRPPVDQNQRRRPATRGLGG